MKIERLIELGLSEENAEVLLAEITKENEEQTAVINGFEEEKSKISQKYEDEIKSIKVENEVEKALTKAGAKNIKAVRALLSLDDAELGENGIVGLSDSIKKLKTGKDTEFLFEKTPFRGVSVGESGGREEMSVSDMNYSQLCAYLEENPNTQL
jgi:hypothetical protein